MRRKSAIRSRSSAASSVQRSRISDAVSWPPSIFQDVRRLLRGSTSRRAPPAPGLSRLHARTNRRSRPPFDGFTGQRLRIRSSLPCDAREFRLQVSRQGHFHRASVTGAPRRVNRQQCRLSTLAATPRTIPCGFGLLLSTVSRTPQRRNNAREAGDRTAGTTRGRRERRRLPRDREMSLSSLTSASVPPTLPQNACRFQKRQPCLRSLTTLLTSRSSPPDGASGG